MVKNFNPNRLSKRKPQKVFPKRRKTGKYTKKQKFGFRKRCFQTDFDWKNNRVLFTGFRVPSHFVADRDSICCNDVKYRLRKTLKYLVYHFDAFGHWAMEFKHGLLHFHSLIQIREDVALSEFKKNLLKHWGKQFGGCSENDISVEQKTDTPGRAINYLAKTEQKWPGKKFKNIGLYTGTFGNPPKAEVFKKCWLDRAEGAAFQEKCVRFARDSGMKKTVRHFESGHPWMNVSLPSEVAKAMLSVRPSSPFCLMSSSRTRKFGRCSLNREIVTYRSLKRISSRSIRAPPPFVEVRRRNILIS